MAQKVKHVCFEVWNVSYFILEGHVCLVPFSVWILKNCLVIVCHHQQPYFVCDSKILLQKRHENVCSVYRLRIAYASRTDGSVFALPKGIEFVPDKRKRDSAHLRFEHHDEGRWSNCLNSCFECVFCYLKYLIFLLQPLQTPSMISLRGPEPEDDDDDPRTNRLPPIKQE